MTSPFRCAGFSYTSHGPEFERTQEFVVRWFGASGGNGGEIVRQRWSFSPAGSTTEWENYDVRLEGVSMLELTIDPDVSGHAAFATLAALRVG